MSEQIGYKVTRTDRSSVYGEGRYRIIYRKGEIVTAPEGTLGIFFFREKRWAEAFSNQATLQTSQETKILEVSLLSQVQKPSIAARFLLHGDKEYSFKEWYRRTINIKKFNRKSLVPRVIQHTTITPPIGSLCCMKVRVLT